MPPSAAPAPSALLESWVRAKRNKQFEEADRIRELLRQQGIEPTMPTDGPKSVSSKGISGWKSLDRVPPNIDPGVGDWRCPGCGNWNWARRDSCNKCGAVKPPK
uniref:RanBP2-type domain-containing protein n=1 Tax=Coccolithus braarudii TaxID=221442 RepID=A0A6T7KMM3_9EUKA